MIKELWYLIKCLFSPMTDYIEVVLMKYFPFKNYLAMSWCGKIITSKPEKITATIKNHERVHLELALQYSSWLAYYWEYLKYWIKGNPIIAPSKAAYYTIPFEMEAYGNELDLNYIVTKDSWKQYKIKNRRKVYKLNRSVWRLYCRNLV